MTIRIPHDTDSVPMVLLAAGDYPACEVASGILGRAERVVCCDGAAAEYISRGGRPFAIVGDCDSLPEAVLAGYAGIVHRSPDQQTNDLTKAVAFCAGSGFGDIVVLGAAGKREDHTVANISLLAEYVLMPGVRSVRMVSDRAVLDAVVPPQPDGYDSILAEYGKKGLFPEMEPTEFGFESFTGQQVSIFTPAAGVRITTRGLMYPLDGALLNGWWCGTLNESLSDSFSIVTTGPAVICRVFE